MCNLMLYYGLDIWKQKHWSFLFQWLMSVIRYWSSRVTFSKENVNVLSCLPLSPWEMELLPFSLPNRDLIPWNFFMLFRDTNWIFIYYFFSNSVYRFILKKERNKWEWCGMGAGFFFWLLLLLATIKLFFFFFKSTIHNQEQ